MRSSSDKQSRTICFAEVVAKAENQLAEAIAYLENKVDEKSSPALDYALGHVLPERKTNDCRTSLSKRYKKVS